MSFLFFFTHSGRSLLGGLAEGQLAVVLLLVLQSGPRESNWGGKLGSLGESGLTNTACDAGGF